MLYSFYRKTVRHIRKFKSIEIALFSNMAQFAPSCRKVAVNYRFGVVISFIKTNKSDCSSQKFVLSPSLELSGCPGIKTETYYIDGKKYSLTFFGIYGLTCIDRYRARTEAAGLQSTQSCLILKFEMILTTSHC